MDPKICPPSYSDVTASAPNPYGGMSLPNPYGMMPPSVQHVYVTPPTVPRAEQNISTTVNVNGPPIQRTLRCSCCCTLFWIIVVIFVLSALGAAL